MNFRAIGFVSGSALMAQAAFMSVPVLCSLLMGESCLSFLGTAFVCLAVGCPMYFFSRRDVHLRARDGLAATGICWLVLSLTGMVPFLLQRATGPVDAFFETVSAYTTTGASILTDVEALSKGLLMWRSFMHWIGGMGILVFMMTLSRSAGSEQMNLMKAESPGPVISKLLPRAKDTAKMLYGIYAFLTVMTIVVLKLSGLPFFDSFCLAFGAAGTGGFTVLNSGCASYTAVQQTIIATACMMFGINFSFYFFLYVRRFKLALSMEEVRAYFCIIAAAVLLITAGLCLSGPYDRPLAALHDAYFQTCSIMTTTGYCVADMNLWPVSSKLIILMLMLCGACAGSTGGGLKVSRILFMIRSFVRECSLVVRPGRVRRIHMDGKVTDESVIRNTGAYVFAAALLMLFTILVLAFTEPFDMETLVSGVVACFNNIGPGFGKCGSFGNYAEFSSFSKVLLALNMLTGRLEIFPIVLLFSKDIWRRF